MSQVKLTQVQYFKVATYIATLVGDDKVSVPYTPQHMVKHINDKFGLYTTAKQLRQMASDTGIQLQVSTANITRGPGAASVKMAKMEADIAVQAAKIVVLTDQLKLCVNQIRLMRDNPGMSLQQ